MAMEETYTKLFQSILRSTIWCEPHVIKVVWVTMLAMCDRNGYVGASLPGLAKAAGCSIEEAQEAIDKFVGPDPHSRTKDHDGRRIEEVDRGWKLLNYRRFRAVKDAESRRAYDRDRKRQEVIRKSAESQEIPVRSAQVDRDRDANVEVPEVPPQPPKGGGKKNPPKVARPDCADEKVWDDWVAHRKKKRATVTDTVVGAAVKKARAAGVELDEFLTAWVLHGTQGFEWSWTEAGKAGTKPKDHLARRVGKAGDYGDGGEF